MKINNILILLICVISIFFQSSLCFSKRSSTEILKLAWEASTKDDLKAIDALVEEMKLGYEQESKQLALKLENFPLRSEVDNYKVMSEYATILFVRAEVLRNQGKTDEAKEEFAVIIDQYPWAQTFDPSRGSYWSVAEKSKASIDLLNGIKPIDPPVKIVPKTIPKIAYSGELIVDYGKYGQFLSPGTKKYHYQISDRKKLAAAVGQGVYPNLSDVYNDPNYKKVVKEGRLEGSQWDFINTTDLEAAYYKWVTAPEPWGVKLFYIGIILEKSKLYYQAIKCYQALVVHYPETLAWTYWHTPWFPGQAAISKIQHIIRMHPELKLYYKPDKIQILNSFDNDPNNKIAITTPGELRLLTSQEIEQHAQGINTPREELGKIVKSLGAGTVRFVKFENGHWQLLVNKKPYIIKGITYAPTPIGQSPDKGTLKNWMEFDPNPAFYAFMDRNLNNKQDSNEPNVGDFALMKEMGVNTLRIYHHPMKLNKELLRKMYQEYGFRVLMGDYIGKYAIGSGTTWSEGTDYENPKHQQAMMDSVKQMVMEYKDEPYVLMWLLGNENNYGVASNADKKPDAYLKFVNKVAKMIKSIDPNHPVAICNGDTLFLDKFGKLASDVDAYGANVYRGDYGFGSFWQQVAEAADKPAFITEYGAPAYSGAGLTENEAQEAQAGYHKGNWLDIYNNSAGFANGIGNAIGGFAFEWVDEWWKNYEPALHDTKADVVGPFPGGYYFEEWFGILGQGDGKNSPFLREPRKVYSTYKELWNSSN